MKELRFFFDVVCPYAYLASTQIERVAEEGGAVLAWRPMLLGGVFRAIGSPGSPGTAAKGRMNLLDMHRWADRWKVPFHFPAEHPRRTVDAMRLISAAEPTALPALAKALFRAYWVDGRDVADRTVLAAIATDHGLAIAAIDRLDIKARLRAVTDEAVGEGIFGAPSFVVLRDGPDGRRHLFFGQDRLHFVARALAGWEAPG
ncbi:MAG: 2-hydroxychromene-2-carboxylate isomerase [Myxococcales bacterium]|nr:2-hydroxychromene-2-carboxylate isomerase [Myxococcales bacterium]